MIGPRIVRREGNRHAKLIHDDTDIEEPLFHVSPAS